MTLPIDSAISNAPVLRTISRVAAIWHLSDADLAGLIDMPPADLRVAMTAAQDGETVALSCVALERLGHLLGIYRALRDLFPIEAQRLAWIREPNAATPFDGTSPLALLSRDAEGLLIVRGFLNGWLAGDLPGATGVGCDLVVNVTIHEK
ncbi:uncharacterized protein DUF2384 [Limimaricola soesokkakensis]|uniref:Uncharacterized protein DUF2384 n=1 Tax=Limimaricola soesokkakensis TaxID=1343159 RepID=A0A1X6ZS32_9RHOB|nr:antitoxin Xre/MbcA/ParS toxin-binding domain-containing protein [Limimaricola soesokkakensis]PSK84062.1 uncharacterized protein DUF2384 [Limimaricola soesokkakensis]SLN59636.1 hypothetical protein LOS8367_02863 [Limimaricola soesokkakensis]